MTQQPQPNPTPAQVAIPIIEFQGRNLILRRNNTIRRIERVLQRDPEIRRELEELGGLATALTSDPEDPISLAYTDRFLSYQNTVSLAEFFSDLERPIPSAQTMAQEIRSIVSIVTAIAQELQECCEQIKKKLDDIDKKLDDQYKKRTEYFDEKAKEIIEKTSEEVVNTVSGESNYRIVATTTFMPTLVLVFNEDIKGKLRRRCQLKFKIDKATEEITDEFIEKLRKDFAELKQRHFYYGKTRITYVSKDKRIRNVMFAKDVDEGKNLFEFIYGILNHQYEEENISYTLGRNRAVFNKRKTPLDGQQPLDLDYNKDCRMELKRVVLLIAGFVKPILIYRNLGL